MKITDVKVAVIGNSPIVRIVTDEGISGYGQVEKYKPYLRWPILNLKDYIIGLDPTDVERVVSKIRRRGAFKPWGSAVSAIEMALWDIAGKAAGVPVYKLLGGKVRDKVRVYNGALRSPMTGFTPADFAANVRWMKERPEKFSIIKQGIAFHSGQKDAVPDFFYGERQAVEIDDAYTSTSPIRAHQGHPDRGLLTEKGFNLIVDCIHAMKEELGDEVGLALDCGPGWVLPDAIRLAKAVEGLHLMWLEDMLTGDYVPWVNADIYRELTHASTTPIHTGEQIYLRQNFKELIETNAVNVLGPDPADVGGIAELKWICEYANLHDIMFAPHGTGDGLLGLAALVQVSATLPSNYIAFEYPAPQEAWWYEIVEGLPNPIVVDSYIDVWDRPGMGVEFNIPAAQAYLSEEDRDFFA